jgi:signal transduction histidine kinase
VDPEGRCKDEFLAVLSHELRNFLAPIRNAVDLLDLAAPGSEAWTRARAVLRRQTGQLTRLVDDLLDVSRISEGKMELRREPLDAREVVQRTAEDLRPLADERGVMLRCVLPGERAWLDADPTGLSQMLGNLLQNAVKFTPAGGEVGIALACRGPTCRIVVWDTGEGISPEDLARLFTRFVQSRRTFGRGQGGLGLGLALVRELAALHGGTVRAASAGVGRGAEFTLELPLASPPEGAPPR